MSTIFPGNYVAHLNAYREQGVEALPGVEFYKVVAALVLDPDNKGQLTNGELPAGTYGTYILSPDLRQDDKPRLDKVAVIPDGATVYRVAANAPGVKEVTVAGTTTIKVDGLGTSQVGGTGDAVSLAAEADGFFPENGVGSAMLSIVDGTALSGDTPIEVITSAPLKAAQDPSAGACRHSPSAILVEVCYYKAAPGPDAEDAHVPYSVEAGQGT